MDVDAVADDKSTSIPADIYFILFGMLDFRSMAALACTCRTAHIVLTRMKRLEFNHVRLSSVQARIRNQVMAMPDADDADDTDVLVGQNIFTFRAPMGFGKTITSLSVALTNGADMHKYLVVVPPKALDTWVKETAKVFGLRNHRITPDTKVLFAHSTVHSHNAHIKAALVAQTDFSMPLALGDNIRVVVTTTTTDSGHSIARSGWATRLIVDEAHALTPLTVTKFMRPDPIRWVLLMSANTVNPSSPAFIRATKPWGTMIIPSDYMRWSLPTVSLKTHSIEPYKIPGGFDESTGYTPPDHKIRTISMNSAAYIDVLLRIFAEIESGHIALYLPDGRTGDALATLLPTIAVGWTLLNFINSTDKIRQFNTNPRSVLVIRLNKSEAINVLASHLIIIRPDWVNPVRYAQIIGRVLRPTSTHKIVPVHLIVPRGVPAMRGLYYEALRHLMTMQNVELPVPDLRAAEYKKADSALRLCGSNLERAAPTEVIAAIGGDYGMAEHLFELWHGDRSPTITASQMRILLGMVDDPQPSIDDDELDELLGL